MPKFDSPLTKVKIASPCSADWEGMFGDERKRFCGECKLNVYNLSGMTRREAEELLENSEGRLCVRYYQRSDGTVLTADCPVGRAKVRDRLSVAATAIFSLVVSLLSGILFVSFFTRSSELPITRRFPIPLSTPTPEPLMGDVAEPRRMPLMGAVAVPSPAPKVKALPAPSKLRSAEYEMRRRAARSAEYEMRRRAARAAGIGDETSL